MIETYATGTGFIFRRGNKQVGELPYKTLELAFDKSATDEERSDMQYHAEDYVPGEVRGGGLTRIVLGPPRDFTHEVTLRAAGNPDYQQYADIGPKKTVRVCGVEEAAAAVSAYQTHYDMGGGNCSEEHGVVWAIPEIGKGRRRKVGRVHYNGKFETIAEIKAFNEELKKKYPATT